MASAGMLLCPREGACLPALEPGALCVTGQGGYGSGTWPMCHPSPVLAHPLQPFRKFLDSFHFCHGLCPAKAPPRPGPASRCGGLALPLHGETARLFLPAPLILKSGVPAPLSQMAPLRLTLPAQGSPRLEMLYPAAPPACPFSGQDAFTGAGRWGPILVAGNTIRDICLMRGGLGRALTTWSSPGARRDSALQTQVC